MSTLALVDRAFKEALAPDPIMTVSEWADAHRVLSQKASSEAGRWRTSRTPFLREIMDCLSISHPAKKVVFKKPTQIGGTECGNNWIGYIIDHAPGPVMHVMPTVSTAKRNSKLRIDPLIEESPRLRGKVAEAKSRDASNTTEQKDFDGGTLIMTGANSAAGLKSTPCRYVCCSEVDEYPRDVENQGDPISLVMARSRAFTRRKAFLESTPTFDGASKIDEEYQNSDRREYHVPCPHCKGLQTLKFEQLQWPKGHPKDALYFCEHCGEGIKERYKAEMLRDEKDGGTAKWIAENPGHDTPGFWINALYSPAGWYTWAEIAADYEEAQREFEQEKKTEKLKTFTNTVLAKTWKMPGDAPEWKRLYLRREKYKIGTVPHGVSFLVCGVDVQKDRIEAEVVGYGKSKESWSIDYQVFLGDTAAEGVWGELENFIGKTFPREDDSAELPIKITGIDSGFNTQHVYNFCRKFPSNRVVATKGDENLSVVVSQPRFVDAKLQGKVHRRAVRLWRIGVSILKGELYGWLKLDPPIGAEKMPTGFCHFPEYDEEYFRQLTAERVVLKQNRKRFSTMEWVKERERNEVLDIRVICRAIASLVGLDRLKEDQIEKRLGAPNAAKPIRVPESEAKPHTPRRGRAPRARSEFW